MKTEGQRLLRAVDASGPDIAKQIKATKQAVSLWRRGQRVPSAAQRDALQQVYGIPRTAWDQLPSPGVECLECGVVLDDGQGVDADGECPECGTPGTLRRASPPPPPPPPAAPPPPAKPKEPKPKAKTQPAAPPPAPPPPPTKPKKPKPAKLKTLDQVVQQIEQLQELQAEPDMVAAAKLKIADAMAKQLALKARLERDAELLEDRVVREHPRWRTIRSAILGALRSHPDALADVETALAEIGEGDE